VQAAVSLLLLLVLTACGPGNATPTVSVDAVYTAAYSTMLAQQATQLALTPPTATATLTPLPTLPPTAASLPTLAFTSPTAGGTFNTGGSGACDSSSFVADVTIPDNTTIDAGRAFTKTWSLLNNGTCTWSTSYSLQFDSGDEMGGSTVAVGSSIAPGSTVSISVRLTAPTTRGTYKGIWRMHNAAGQAFGDTPWVQIRVGEGATATVGTPPTAGPSPTHCTGNVAMDVEVDSQAARNFTLAFSPSGPTYNQGGMSVTVQVPCGWTGTVTPSKEGVTFKPLHRTINNFPPPATISFSTQ
jgi:hypothetical protein